MTGGVVSRIFFAAILAGAVAGLLLTGFQKLAVVPMILEAESYEGAGHDHGEAAAHEHDEEAWAPQDGMERTAYTGLANVITAIGFGLLLTAGYALRGGIDWRRGVLWGLGGFMAFSLAPSFGHPPELPGAAAAELGARQFWWVLTVVLTAGGLALIAFAPRVALKGLGALLIVVPHIVGAPHPEEHGGLAPAELAQSFIYASLVSNAVFWVILGGLTGFLFSRSGEKTGGAGNLSPAG